MMSSKKRTYEELKQRLTDAEAIIATLRRGEVDAIISERNVALLRAKEAEQALQQSQRELAIRNQIANIFLTIPDDEMYGEVLQVVLDAMESKHGVFGYVREDGAVVVPSLTRDIWDKCQVPDKDIVFPRETWGGIWGRALVEKKTFYSNKDFRVPKGHIPVHRAMATPVIYRGEVIGYFTVGNRTRDYDDKDKELLETIANYVAPILNARLERDNQEKERKRAEEAVRESEAKYSTLVEHAKDGVVIVQDGICKFANKAMVDICGYGVEEISGKHLMDIGTESADAIAQRYRSRMAGEEISPLYEAKIQCKDGTIKEVEVSAAPIQYQGNSALMGFVRDITERKKLEQLKDEFIGLVSHELRTPLTVIGGGLSTLLTEWNRLSPNEVQQLLKDALLESESLSHLIENLLELSRAQAQQLALYSEMIDIKSLVSETLSKIKRQAPSYRFVTSFPDKLQSINADPLRIERILYNLLDNAAKYSPPGSQIKVSANAEPERLVIGVSDHGKGLSSSEQARIFGPFQRLENDKPDQARGAGLGLMVCRRLVEAHGGEIWVDSKKGRGSTFFFSLPRRKRTDAGKVSLKTAK